MRPKLKTAVARKGLQLQEETRNETDRWSGAPRGQGREVLRGSQEQSKGRPSGPGRRGPSQLAGDRCSVAPVPHPSLVTR